MISICPHSKLTTEGLCKSNRRGGVGQSNQSGTQWIQKPLWFTQGCMEQLLLRKLILGEQEPQWNRWQQWGKGKGKRKGGKGWNGPGWNYQKNQKQRLYSQARPSSLRTPPLFLVTSHSYPFPRLCLRREWNSTVETIGWRNDSEKRNPQSARIGYLDWECQFWVRRRLGRESRTWGWGVR